MKDIFEFNHIDKKLSEENVKTLKDFYNIIKKGFGVSKNHINVLNFLMMNQLQSLFFV